MKGGFVIRGSWGCPERTQPGAAITEFLSLCKKQFKSETDAKKQKWFIENESTHLRGKCGELRKRDALRKSQWGIITPP